MKKYLTKAIISIGVSILVALAVFSISTTKKFYSSFLLESENTSLLPSERRAIEEMLVEFNSDLGEARIEDRLGSEPNPPNGQRGVSVYLEWLEDRFFVAYVETSTNEIDKPILKNAIVKTANEVALSHNRALEEEFRSALMIETQREEHLPDKALASVFDRSQMDSLKSIREIQFNIEEFENQVKTSNSMRQTNASFLGASRLLVLKDPLQIGPIDALIHSVDASFARTWNLLSQLKIKGDIAAHDFREKEDYVNKLFYKYGSIRRVYLRSVKALGRLNMKSMVDGIETKIKKIRDEGEWPVFKPIQSIQRTQGAYSSVFFERSHRRTYNALIAGIFALLGTFLLQWVLVAVSEND